jgi:hypothetical protein
MYLLLLPPIKTKKKFSLLHERNRYWAHISGSYYKKTNRVIINVKVEFIIKSCVQMLSSPKFGLCLFLRFYLLAQTCSSVLIFGILALKSVILKSVFLSWLDESLIGCVNRVLGGDWLVGYKKDKRTSFSLSGWPQLSSSSCQ